MTHIYGAFNHSSKHSSLFGPGGLRIKGQDPTEMEKPGPEPAGIKNQTAEANEAGDLKPGPQGLSKFAGVISARLQNAKPDSPEAALLLADNLTAVAEEIKKEFGQGKANEFMSRILKATDAGVNEKELTIAISGFFRQLEAESRNNADFKEKLENIRTFLNKGLDQPLEPKPLGALIEDGEKPGLSYALNNFFGSRTEVSENGQVAEAKGFNSGFERVYMRVRNGSADTGENDVFAWRHTFGAIKDISPETLNSVSSFLRNQIGDAALAEYLEKDSDFLGAVTTSIAVVATEYGRRAASEYVSFLNQNVAPAISSASGTWFLKGWQLDGHSPAPGARPANDVWVSGGGQVEPEKKPDPGGAKNDSGPPVWTVEVDMNDLYTYYKKAGAAEISLPEGGALNSPTGNLIDVQA